MQTNNGTGDGQELVDEFGAVGCVAYGLLRNVGAGLAQRKGVAGVQHAAVSVATAVNQVLLGLLSGGTEHGGTVEILGEHGLRDFRTKVAQIYAEGVTACLGDIFESLLHVDFALYNTDGAFVDAFLAKFLLILGDNGLAAVNSQRFGETVARNGDDSDLNNRYVVHLLVKMFVKVNV